VKGLIGTIVRGIVDHPEDVEVEERETGRRVVYQLRMHPDDRGHVIGKAGATVDALRTLVSGIALRRGLRVEIEILD
jgi:predicted RNA-binding protein YlqC (UPF0109 family)